MIKNFTQFNEGIKHLLVGPTKEEVWHDLMNGKLKGLLKTIPTSPEDFFNQMKDGCKIIKRDKHGNVHYGKNKIILFEEEENINKKYLFISHFYIWSIFENMYGMIYSEIQPFIQNLLKDDEKWSGLIPRYQ